MNHLAFIRIVFNCLCLFNTLEHNIIIVEKFTDITNNANVESETSQHSDDDIKQLEEYLKRSAISSQSSDGDIDNAEVKVRSYVRKFLALRMNKDPLIRNIDMGESQRKTVSFAVHQRRKHLDAKVNIILILA